MSRYIVDYWDTNFIKTPFSEECYWECKITDSVTGVTGICSSTHSSKSNAYDDAWEDLMNNQREYYSNQSDSSSRTTENSSSFWENDANDYTDESNQTSSYSSGDDYSYTSYAPNSSKTGSGSTIASFIGLIVFIAIAVIIFNWVSKPKSNVREDNQVEERQNRPLNTIEQMEEYGKNNTQKAGWVICKSCNGKGTVETKIECSKCEGKGNITCKNCNGKGGGTCGICGGTGSVVMQSQNFNNVTCPSCSGTGKINCDYCSSLGSFPCDSCIHTGFFIQKNICSVCNGNGKILNE